MIQLTGKPIAEPRPVAERLTGPGMSLDAAHLLVGLVEGNVTTVSPEHIGSLVALTRLGCVEDGEPTDLGRRVAVLLERMGVGEP